MAAAGVLAFLVGMTVAGREGDGAASQGSDAGGKGCCGDEGSPDGGCEDEKPNASQASNAIDSLASFVKTAVELFSSAAVWVLLGVVISASASIWLPPASAAASAPSATVAYLSADGDIASAAKSIASRGGLFLLSLPMTICEHGIVALAESLRGVGFSAGTAVALVVTGPATNAGTLLMLSRLSAEPSTGRRWILDAARIATVILVFGVALSYLADGFGSAAMMDRTEAAEPGGGGAGASLPSWLDRHAVSLAGLFTAIAVVQSSFLLLRPVSPQSSS